VAVEREVKLGAGSGFRLPSLRGVVDGAVPGPAEELTQEAVYHDADDLRLLRAGITLRHRSDEGWTLKLPRPPTGEGLDRDEIRLAGGPDAPPEAAIEALRAHLRGDPLVAVAWLTTRRRRVPIRDGGRGELAEVTDDRVDSRDRDGTPRSFRQLEVELRPAAPDDLLERVRDRLLAAGATDDSPLPKLALALGSDGRRGADGASRGSPAERLVRDGLADAQRRYLRHDPAAVVGDDPEDVHQARVGLRRLRATLRTMAPLLDADWADGLDEDARWLAHAWGDVRDADVMRDAVRTAADDFPEGEHVALEALGGRLDAARADARERLLEARREPRFEALMRRLAEAGEAPQLRPEAERAGRGDLAALARRPLTRLRKAVRRMGRTPTDADLHRVRRRARDLRYAGELLGPALGGRGARLATRAKRVQSMLGDHHDAVVLRGWLRDAAEDAPWRQAYAAGVLGARQERITADAEAALPKALRRVRRAGKRLPV
jgi:CHAD domain-containing protein